VPFGHSVCDIGAGGRQGYSVADHAMERHTLQLEAMPPGASLEREGVELLSVRDELEAAGITEDNCDLTKQEHRAAVGRVLIAKAEDRFGPGKKALHMADTSRVSGAAVYGEATVRDTTAGSPLRTSHQAFHIDKYLPCVAKFWGKRGSRDGAEAFVDTYWKHWEADFAKLGMGKAAVSACIAEASPGLVNLWVSLTPGEIEQQPLAVMDVRSTGLSERAGLDDVSAVPVTFPGLQNDTLTLMRASLAKRARFYWRPRMKFGEVLLFSTTATPHSAVWLPDAPRDTPRKSAEIRLIMADRAAPSAAP